MKIFLFVMLLLLALPTYASSQDAESLYQQAVKTLQDDAIGQKGMEKAVEFLTQGIALEPNNLKMLRLRASLLSNSGRIQDAHRDVLAVATITPENIDAQMLLCLMEESLGTPMNMNRICYQRVADMYKSKISSPLQPDDRALGNYVLALSMAENPDAGRYKEIWFTNITQPEWRENFQKLFTPFDRKALLLPVTQKANGTAPDVTAVP